jgi:hypothetical protein
MITKFFGQTGIKSTVALLRATLLLASLTIVLENLQLLEWLDSLMLRIEPSAATRSSPTKSQPYTAIVLVISKDLFEIEFGGTTPIDRLKLNKYVQEIQQLIPKPRVLVLDFDLSPTVTGRLGPNNDLRGSISISQPQGQIDLEKYFDSMNVPEYKGSQIRGQESSNSPKYIVLGTTTRNEHEVNSDGTRWETIKEKWEKQLASRGVNFGCSYLSFDTMFGTILKFKDEPASIANVANALVKGYTYFQPGRCESSGISKGVDLKAINFAESLAKQRVGLCALDLGIGIRGCLDQLQMQGLITEKTVLFLGGNYSDGDRYQTINQLPPLPGVILHAFIYDSILHPQEPLHFWAFLLDIVIGLILGAALEVLWKSFHASSSGTAIRTSVVLVALTLVFVSLWAVSHFSTFLLTHGLWFNPAIVAIGLLLHTFVSSLKGAQHVNDPRSIRHVFFGLPTATTGALDKSVSWTLHVGAYWTIVTAALYCLFLSRAH